MNNVLNAVSELKRWIDNTNNQLQTGMPFIRIQPEVIQVSSFLKDNEHCHTKIGSFRHQPYSIQNGL